MRSRLRIPLQNQSDLSASTRRVASTLLRMMVKLERNWPLSAALMLLAIVALSQV
jgi:hypothetical protein